MQRRRLLTPLCLLLCSARPTAPLSLQTLPLSASLTAPLLGAIDPSDGSLLVSSDNRVLRVSPAGATSTLAGTLAAGGWSDGPALGWPLGGAAHSQLTGGTTDGQGRHFFPCAGAVATVLAANGSLGLLPGTWGASYSNVAWDATTASLVCISAVTRNVTRHYPNGTRAWLAGTGAPGSGSGTLAAASFFMTGSGAGYTPGLAVNSSSGDIFLADAHGIRVLSPASGTASGAIAGMGAPAAADGVGAACGMSAPTGLALSPGRLWVVERDNHVVRALQPQGAAPCACATAAGLLGASDLRDGVGSAARFSSPLAIVYDGSASVLYVADYGNSAVRTLSVLTLAVATLAGAPSGYAPLPFLDGPRGTGTTYRPLGLTLDAAAGVLLMPDWNNAVRTVALGSGALGTATGAGGVPSGGAGNFYGAGRSASFSAPAGLALDAASGTVYVADAGNHAVRAVARGLVRTIAGAANTFNPAWAGYNPNSAGTLGVWTRAPVGGGAQLTAFDAASGQGLLMTYGWCCSNVLYRWGGANRSLAPVAGSGGGVSAADGVGVGAVFGFNSQPPHQLVYSADAGVGYIAEPASHSIRRFFLNGSVGTVAGASRAAGLVNVDGAPSAEPAAAAQFSAPTGLALLPDGSLTVSDSGNARLRALLQGGRGGVVTVAGSGALAWVNGVGAAAAFNLPGAQCWDAATASLLVLDLGNHAIRRATSIGNLTGNVTTLAGRGCCTSTGADGTGSAATFSGSLTSIVCSSAGHAYVAEGVGTLRRVDTASGATVTLAGLFGANAVLDGVGALARLGSPTGLSLDAAGGLVFCDGAHVRRADAATGAVTTLFSLAAAVLQAPTGLVHDAARGRLYVSEPAAGKISAIDPATGAITRLAGALGSAPGAPGRDGPALAPFSGFHTPRALAVDGSGAVVYISDAGARSVRRYNASAGTVDFFVGSASGARAYAQCAWPGGAGTSANFSSPSALALNGSGTLLVADSALSCVVGVALGGGSSGAPPRHAVTGAAGACGCQGYQDGAAASARFFLASGSSGLAPDPSFPGAFLLTDIMNNVVRRLLGNGSVGTAAGTGAAASANGALGVGQLNKPLALAVPPAGAPRPYAFAVVLEHGSSGLRVLHLPNGTLGTLVEGGAAGFADGPGATARFNLGNTQVGGGVGAGLAMDGNLTTYVADYNNHRLRAVLFPSGSTSTLLGTGSAGCAGGGAGTGATTAFPSALAFASAGPSVGGGAGTLYFADACGLRAIALYTGPQGTSAGAAVAMLAGTGLPNHFLPGHPVAGLRGYDAGLALGASFSAPVGLALAPDGSALFVADSGTGSAGGAVRRLTLGSALGSQTVSTLLATGALAGALLPLPPLPFSLPPPPLALSAPFDVRFDGCGALLILDAGARAVLRYALPSGPLTLLAGNGSAASGNGLNARSQAFAAPRGLVVGLPQPAPALLAAGSSSSTARPWRAPLNPGLIGGWAYVAEASGRMRVLSPLCNAAATGVPGAQYAASAWPWRGSNAQPGAFGLAWQGTGAPGPAGAFAVAWNVSLGAGTSSNCNPLLDTAGNVIVALSSGSVRCLSGANGSQLWAFSAGNDVRRMALGADGSLYFGSQDGFFYALSGATGTLRWRVRHLFGSSNYNTAQPSITPDGALVLFPAADNYLYALDAGTGAVAWYLGTFFVCFSTPVCGGDTLFTNLKLTPTAYSFAAMPTTGPVNSTPQWVSGGPAMQSQISLAPGGNVLYGAWGNLLVGVNASSGAALWSTNAGSGANPAWAPPALDAAGGLFYTTNLANMAVLKLNRSRAGAVQWAATLPAAALNQVNAPVISSSGAVVYYAGNNGVVYALNATSGAQLFSLHLGRTALSGTPALGANGWLYTVTNDGYAIALRGASSASASATASASASASTTASGSASVGPSASAAPSPSGVGNSATAAAQVGSSSSAPWPSGSGSGSSSGSASVAARAGSASSAPSPNRSSSASGSSSSCLSSSLSLSSSSSAAASVSEQQSASRRGGPSALPAPSSSRLPAGSAVGTAAAVSSASAAAAASASAAAAPPAAASGSALAGSGSGSASGSTSALLSPSAYLTPYLLQGVLSGSSTSSVGGTSTPTLAAVPSDTPSRSGGSSSGATAAEMRPSPSPCASSAATSPFSSCASDSGSISLSSSSTASTSASAAASLSHSPAPSAVIFPSTLLHSFSLAPSRTQPFTAAISSAASPRSSLSAGASASPLAAPASPSAAAALPLPPSASRTPSASPTASLTRGASPSSTSSTSLSGSTTPSVTPTPTRAPGDGSAQPTSLTLGASPAGASGASFSASATLLQPAPPTRAPSLSLSGTAKSALHLPSPMVEALPSPFSALPASQTPPLEQSQSPTVLALPVLSSPPLPLSSAAASASPLTGTFIAAPPSAPPSPFDALLTATQSFGAAPAAPTASASTGAALMGVAGGAIAAAAGGALRVATLDGGLYFYSGAASAVLLSVFLWLLLRTRMTKTARAPAPFAARAPAFLPSRQRKAVSNRAGRLGGSASKQGLAMTENPLRAKRRLN